jgi:hypothetical protein
MLIGWYSISPCIFAIDQLGKQSPLAQAVHRLRLFVRAILAFLVAGDLLEDGRTPVVRVDQLAEAIANANTLAGGRMAAQAPPHQLPGLILIPQHIPMHRPRVPMRP